MDNKKKSDFSLYAKINSQDSVWKRKDQAQKLKQSLRSNEKDFVTSVQHKVHIFFPDEDSHQNHVTGQV